MYCIYKYICKIVWCFSGFLSIRLRSLCPMNERSLRFPHRECVLRSTTHMAGFQQLGAIRVFVSREWRYSKLRRFFRDHARTPIKSKSPSGHCGWYLEQLSLRPTSSASTTSCGSSSFLEALGLKTWFLTLYWTAIKHWLLTRTGV